jgi:hypothetical protein
MPQRTKELGGHDLGHCKAPSPYQIYEDGQTNGQYSTFLEDTFSEV